MLFLEGRVSARRRLILIRSVSPTRLLKPPSINVKFAPRTDCDCLTIVAKRVQDEATATMREEQKFLQMTKMHSGDKKMDLTEC